MNDQDEHVRDPRPVDETGAVTDYLGSLAAWGNTLPLDALPDPPPPGAGAHRLQRLKDMVLSGDARFRLRYAFLHRYTSALRPIETKRAATLALRSPLLLHLGCGSFPKSGWVNIDLAGHPVDLRWNLARPLPFESESIDGIFHEHVLEHLPLATGFEFLRSSHRLLRPGGVLRVVVPDAGSYLRSYANEGTGVLEHVRPGRPTRMLAINELFYLYTHVAMYDEQTLSMFLRAAGFRSVQSLGFGESRLDPCPDSEHRRAESMYLEAVK